MLTPAVTKSDNEDISCSTTEGCTSSRHRSTWPQLHPSQTVDVADAGDSQPSSRHHGDAGCGLQQQQSLYSGDCASRQSAVPRRREWVTCVQRRRLAASTTSTMAAPRPAAAPAVLRRQKTIASAADVAAVDAVVSAIVSSPSPAATTTSDDELTTAEDVLNYETVLRCLDSCDKILLRHSTVIT